MPTYPRHLIKGQPVLEGGLVYHVGNQERKQFHPFTFTYNPDWKHHPNFGWKQPENSLDPYYINSPQHLTQKKHPQQSSKLNMIQKVSSLDSEVNANVDINSPSFPQRAKFKIFLRLLRNHI